MSILPGALRRSQQPVLGKRPPGPWPPWHNKPILTPPGRQCDVEWVPIERLRPGQSEATTWARNMMAPGPSYPALRVHRTMIIMDGHHRYWLLMRGGWRDKVPVVFVIS